MPIELENLAAHLAYFYHTYPIVMIGLATGLGLLAIFRPMATLKTTGIVLALAVAAYCFTLFVDMAGTGRSQKKTMIHKVE
jgi:hypothetical protein